MKKTAILSALILAVAAGTSFAATSPTAGSTTAGSTASVSNPGGVPKGVEPTITGKPVPPTTTRLPRDPKRAGGPVVAPKK